MNCYLSIFVIVIVLGNILGYAFLLYCTRKMPKDDVAVGEKRDHAFDGIYEYNNPLPKWWMWLFVICIIFALVYLTLYPGLGNYKGLLHWTSSSQWEKQEADANQKYAPIFAKYAATPIPELAKDKQAMKMAQRIFVNTCAACHGVNAQGAKGFPNLTTNVWLFGGTPEDLKKTISNGRIGMMPPMAGVIGEENVPAVANYVLKISGQSHDSSLAAQGEPKFKAVCAACHGPDGKGNQMIGAPNLTAGKWIFGGTLKDIEETIHKGRSAQMPAHESMLGADKVHLMAAYIYGLANANQTMQPASSEKK